MECNSNPFTDALEQLYQLHTSEMQVLRSKVKEQTEQLDEKERIIEKMRKNVSKAKKKIQQQSDHIRMLESQLEPNASKGSVENFKPHFDKTTVSLFGTSPPVPRDTSTLSEQVIVIDGNYEPIDYSFDKTRNEADSEADSECTNISVELVADDRDKDSAIASNFQPQPDEAVDNGQMELMQPHDVDVTRNDGAEILDHPQTCVSLFDTSAKTSPRKPLHLKRQSHKVKYKNASPESLSSTSHETNSPNVLNETTELPSPENLSPHFLASTPHHSQPSPGPASLPLFQSTTKANNIGTSKLDEPPSGTQTNPIPISDSQYSLDVSQSCPPSPELCSGSGSIQLNNQRYFQSSTPNNEAPFPSPLPHTASSRPVTQVTMIPITPGITTVQTFLGRVASGVPMGNKRQMPQETEEALPVKKKKQQLLYEDNGIESGDESAGAGSNVIRGLGQRISNEDIGGGRLAGRYDLPSYPCVTKILKRSDRDKLDGKACPECNQWYDDSDGIHDNQRQHLKHTCRHKNLYPPPDTDPHGNLWDISFPDSDVCEQIMRK